MHIIHNNTLALDDYNNICTGYYHTYYHFVTLFTKGALKRLPENCARCPCGWASEGWNPRKGRCDVQGNCYVRA